MHPLLQVIVLELCLQHANNQCQEKWHWVAKICIQWLLRAGHFCPEQLRELKQTHQTRNYLLGCCLWGLKITPTLRGKSLKPF